MPDHDAASFLGVLRDHLSAHDRHLAFLLGAGTSSCINIAPHNPETGHQELHQPLIPAVWGLTTECRAAVASLGEEHASVWDQLRDECVSLGSEPHIESLLDRVRAKIEALAEGDSLSGLTRAEWEAIDGAIRQKIAKLAAPDISTLPREIPHHRFARWIRNTVRKTPVEIFTTNYDILLEASFDLLRVPHFDGFIGSQHAYFSPEAVENDELLPSPTWIRYWKLHGSVTWSEETIAGKKRITRGHPKDSGEMVLPSYKKYDQSKKLPYRALMDRLGRVLARPNALLVVAGFSFGDQHINAIILDALNRYPTTHLIALMYSDVSESDEPSKWAEDYPNIMYVGPNGGVLRRQFGHWSSGGRDEHALEAVTTGFAELDVGDSSKAKLGLGDFNVFGRFLNSLAGGGETR
ncbi:SIR2 family protein [Synechococcus sp. CS-1332]|uniref:SIR2 family protein n=1 Tax=Synechococcus sp. CS-1332 TaxID=2847972 RepID=UPI00223B5CF9|nr:SIR2 family protein [Synechococcus sp. CS-1332]MCT0206498.1 SIR2 family protein [Synechococcus sp. CS-1332]